MTSTVSISVDGAPAVSLPAGSLVRDVPHPDADPASGLPFVGALVNNDLAALDEPLDVDASVSFLTMASHHGLQIYVRSLSFLLAKAVRELFPSAAFSIEHTLGPGLFCEFALDGRPGLSPDQASALSARIRSFVDSDLPILRRSLSYADAVARFSARNRPDKLSLLRVSASPKVSVNVCGDFLDLDTGPLVPSASPLRFFEIIPYHSGFVLQMPSVSSAPGVPPFRPVALLAETFREYNRWGKILGVNSVGRLDEIIADGSIRDFVKVAEALHEKKIAAIADRIAASPSVKWILIAGPSSSGKTTFAKRLAIQLRVNGLRPVTLGTDDYFVDRPLTPRHPSGEFDFEHIRAVDLPSLNRDLADLDAGRPVNLPTFDFVRGCRAGKSRPMQIAPDQVVILEGIHALNPELTPAIPDSRKFRIYISALTQLNLDDDHRIPSSDNRLVRRMVRDFNFRGHSPARTLSMWPSVALGEQRWIFPFQENADALFNSALDYELAVLAPIALPLLARVKPDLPVYAEARRMSRFLSHFLPLSPDLPPPTSIIREFVGHSAFDY